LFRNFHAGIFPCGEELQDAGLTSGKKIASKTGIGPEDQRATVTMKARRSSKTYASQAEALYR
jgi:hypothetical protein